MQLRWNRQIKYTIVKSHIVIASNDISLCILRNVEHRLEPGNVSFELERATPLALVEDVACNHRES